MTLTIDQLSETAEVLHDSVDDFKVGETGTTGQTAVEAAKNVAAGTTEMTELSVQPSTTGRRATQIKADSTTRESAAQSEKSPSDTESGAEQALLGVEEVGDTDMASSTDSIPWSGLDGGKMSDSEMKSSNGRAEPSGADES